MYCIAGKFGEFILFKYLTEKVWQINRSVKRLLIVSTNLDGFSLANHERFTKFTKLSPCQIFPLYNYIHTVHNYTRWSSITHKLH